MSIDLQLEEMSVSEKLEVMEAIWASFCNKPSDFSSPAWHTELLADRKRRLAAGEATVSDWGATKTRMQNLGQ